MLEHTSEDSQFVAGQPVQSAFTPNPSLDLTGCQAEIKDYLDGLCAPLIGTIPYAARQQRRAAMRAELDTLIAAHQELGSPLEEAVTAAIRQHSASHSVTGKRLGETALPSRGRTPSARPATLLALGLFSAFYAADATQLAWRVWSRLFGIGGDGMMKVTNGDSTTMLPTAGLTAFYRFELFVVPLLVGLVTGLLVRHRAGRGVVNALALLAIPALLLPGLTLALSYAGFIMDPLLGGWIPSPLPGITGVTPWVVLGYAGAQLGHWLSQKGRRMRASFSAGKRFLNALRRWSESERSFRLHPGHSHRPLVS